MRAREKTNTQNWHRCQGALLFSFACLKERSSGTDQISRVNILLLHASWPIKARHISIKMGNQIILISGQNIFHFGQRKLSSYMTPSLPPLWKSQKQTWKKTSKGQVASFLSVLCTPCFQGHRTLKHKSSLWQWSFSLPLWVARPSVIFRDTWLLHSHSLFSHTNWTCMALMPALLLQWSDIDLIYPSIGMVPNEFWDLLALPPPAT